MRKLLFLIGSLILLVGLIACSDNSEDANEENGLGDDIEQDSEDNDQSEEVEDSNDDQENEEDVYTEETIDSPYYITGRIVMLGENSEALGFHFQRQDADQSREERLLQSLQESDFTSIDVLADLEDVRLVDDSTIDLIFNEDHKLRILTSAEQYFLTEMLHEFSDLYGFSTINFYVEDDQGVIYGQYGDLETMEVELEENRGYYVYEDPVEQPPEPLFLNAQTVGEEVKDETLFNFEETIEAISYSNQDAEGYRSAIGESIQIIEVSVEDRHATVVLDHEENRESIEELEVVLQLTALDFQLESIQLIDEQEQTDKTFVFDRPHIE
ncbi:hypothetical protein [Alkalibacillus haloalkaliphilus]|uniref:GerMN domain-containing protein n=1 Tax=Alkalibacillus haloalkaliphilus TaxID=94136 RepID=A0A511VZW4_9BACI|nr:hypothetical protein [Alkalibacillus haloalkaliphilus]GEN44379.1 hypothetical protein AHA02nite_01550 [Alkalibacillus haloalkaliphilus]